MNGDLILVCHKYKNSLARECFSFDCSVKLVNGGSKRNKILYYSLLKSELSVIQTYSFDFHKRLNIIHPKKLTRNRDEGKENTWFNIFILV